MPRKKTLVALDRPPPLPLEQQVEKDAQDLHCGDWFRFREADFLCLSVVTDERHTSTFVTCLLGRDARGPCRAVQVIHFFRTKRVLVLGHFPLSLHAHHLEREEISDDEQERLAALLNAHRKR